MTTPLESGNTYTSQLSTVSSYGTAGGVSDSSDFDVEYDEPNQLPFVSKRRAMKICKEFVTIGAWKKITLDKFTFTSVKGGLSNLLYLCSLVNSSSEHDDSDSPQHLLLRVHCQIHDSKMEENIIFTVLSERMLGPNLYGVFNGGRVEEYIKSCALLPEHLCIGSISDAIAEMLARVHSLHIPISKKPRWIGDVFDRWICHSRRMRISQLHNKLDVKLITYLLELPYEQEAKFIKSITSCLKDKVVFCHNDLQEGNILNKSESTVEPDLLFIDYEYCSYNYRSFDIANHLCEWAIDYKIDTYPHFKLDMDKYPSVDQQRRFIQSYIRAVRLEQAHSSDSEINGHSIRNEISDLDLSSVEQEDEEVENILSQIPIFTMASNLIWCLWSIVQADLSPVTFGYLEHAMVRWELYTEGKKKILDKLYIV